MAILPIMWKNADHIHAIGTGEHWSFAPPESVYFLDRIRKNLLTLKAVFAVNCRIHIRPRLMQMIGDEVQSMSLY